MNQPLFWNEMPEFIKVSAETAMPEDPNAWGDAVLQALYKQVPYLSDFDLHVEMSAVDGERGYGLGHVKVTSKTEAPMTAPPEQLQSAGIRESRIPIIVKDNKLMPLDLLVTDDSKMLPLTEGRLRQAMFRPQNFDVTSKTPGDQSMIGQLYPPFRQNYGFGGGGVAVSAGMGGKTASIADEFEQWLLQGTPHAPATKKIASAKQVKMASVGASALSAVLPTANVSDIEAFDLLVQDPVVKVAFMQNAAALEVLHRFSGLELRPVEKIASSMGDALRPSVVQIISNQDGTYRCKTASHLAWEPREVELSRKQLVQHLGAKLAAEIDQAGATTVAPEGAAEVSGEALPGEGAGPISAPGMYQVQTEDGQTLVGLVITNLLDTDGTALPISLFLDGQHAAVQADMVGTPAGEFTSPGCVPADQATGYGVFYFEAGGIPVATLPLRLGASVAGMEGGPAHFSAETFDGRPVEVSIQGYVSTVVGVDGQMIVPETWCWVSLDQAEEVGLAETAATAQKVASCAQRAAQVTIRAGSADCFSLRGAPVEKLAAEDRDFLTQDQTLFVLVGCGANPAQALNKMAHALSTPGKQTQLEVQRAIKLATEVRGESYVRAQEYLENTPTFRHRLWKEAAVIPDPIAVDTVLSLGFLNPENISAFVGYLPTLDEAQRRMCELLIGARLGLRELSDGALERAIRAVEDVIEGLKVIAFQG